MLRAKLAINDKFEIITNQFLNSDFNHIFNEINFFKLHSESNNDLYIQLVRTTDKKVFANFLNDYKVIHFLYQYSNITNLYNLAMLYYLDNLI